MLLAIMAMDIAKNAIVIVISLRSFAADIIAAMVATAVVLFANIFAYFAVLFIFFRCSSS